MKPFEPDLHPRTDAGQFSTKEQSAPEAALTPHIRQSEPLARVSFEALNTPFSNYIDRPDDFLLDPPYQRASVWTVSQRRDLIRSILLGLPIGSVTVNFRGYGAPKMFAVIDGKQRIETLREFTDDRFDVPRDWFPDRFTDETSHNRDTVVYSDLNVVAHRSIGNTVVPQLRANVATVQEEAEIFRLLNSGGTPQSDETLAAAAEVELS